MSEPFLADIQIFAFNFPPRGYAQCDGQILPINQFQSLFSLLGTTYGGDGRTTFALPDLRGRIPVHEGQGSGLTNVPLGARQGEEEVTLATNQIPAHRHGMNALSDDGTTNQVNGNQLANAGAANVYGPANNLVAMRANTVPSPPGTGGAHNNMQPYLALNYCIALTGVFPSRN